MLTATQKGEKLPIKWRHNSDGKNHEFLIGNIERSNEEEVIKLSYNGSPFDVEIKGEEEVKLPPLGTFNVLNHRVVHAPDQYVVVSFSDPLQASQELEGLIRFYNLDVDLELKGNNVKITPNTRQSGTLSLFLDKGITNIYGISLGVSTSLNIEFDQPKPQIRWVDNVDKCILPTNGLVQLPIEAIGLNEVEVEIIRIYEQNMIQFLQTNSLRNSSELRRVGAPIKRHTVSLVGQGVANLQKWNRYTLDLTNLISQEPGAVHQVRLFFSRKNVAFECENLKDFTENEGWQTDNGYEFDTWDSYNYYYAGDYDYRERNNPCHPMYYRYNAQMLQRNLLASDIGLAVKTGKFNNLYVTTTDLIKAEPLPNTTVKIYNFQQQVIAQTTTNAEGLAELKIEGTPFVAVAENGAHKTYLKIDNNSALSVSHFNTSGTENQDGYKGTIYTERGVWRPGDSLYLSFVLEDKENLVPEGSPVVLEFVDPLNRLQSRIVKTNGVNGMYTFRLATSLDAPTGNWQAKVLLGNSTFYKTIPVETIKPNRLKINLDFGVEELTALNPEINGKLSVKWLHGAVAKNLKAKIEAVVQNTSISFSDYENYYFDDQAHYSYHESLEIFDGEVDENGEAQVFNNMKLNGNVPSKLIANLKTTVFEKSGNSSVDRFTIPYYPYKSYIGARAPDGNRRSNWLQTDTPQTYQIAMVSPDGKPIKGTHNVSVEVYKIGWRWWWDRSSDNISHYLSSSSSNLIHTGTATVKNGKGKYTFEIERPNWGRFYVRFTDPVSGHTSGQIVYYEWPWYAGRPAEQSAQTVLEFSADKE
ncbi:MAG: hypothetical protein KDC92_16325, partial [Bacteroidetes bacterium]|nr:hypothetical protein [Bacteroidota bacterium]